MTESIIQSEPFHKDFCILDVTVVYIDSNTSSISLSLIIVFVSLTKECHILFYLHFLYF